MGERKLAGGYELRTDSFRIDGEEFPWWVSIEGPRVESMGADVPYHLLWVPVLVDKPAPATWDDRGEPLTTTVPSEGDEK